MLLADILDVVRCAQQAEQLSLSELCVLRYLPTNLTRPEIASELSVSLNTVNTYVRRRIYAKLSARDRSTAVQRAGAAAAVVRPHALAQRHRILAAPVHLPTLDHGLMDPSPSLYLIRISGHLGPTALSAFPSLFPSLVSQRQDSDTLLTGLLPDRSALYGVLAEVEALGLDLVELRKLVPRHPSPRPAALGSAQRSGW